MSGLPPFPVDDATLLAVEHALGGAYEVDDDGTHTLVGADYTLSQLLDFMAGTMGEDPNAEVLSEGHEVAEGAPLWEQIAGAKVVVDSRVHYTPHCIIDALIAEVRRLRGADA